MEPDPVASSPSDRPPESRATLTLPGNPRIISRSDHPISRKSISDEALKVLYRLRSLGFKAYLVGGGVRDLYLGRKPKDFDVGTDARPSRLKKSFRNCRIIGRRFRIAHIFFPNNSIVEVATFRSGEVHSIQKGDGVVLLDNQYGTPEEDAKRRDLTVNGLFYDIESFSIIDYVGGVEDLKNGIVRTIKDPDKSFTEDPVRMVRALRHAARTSFTVEENTLQAIYRNRFELAKSNSSRLMEEVFRDLRGGAAYPFFQMLTETHLLDVFLPRLAEQLRAHGLSHPLFRRLKALDRLVAEERELNNALLVSVLLHTVLIPKEDVWTGEAPHPPGVWPMLQSGFQEVSKQLRISRRDSERVAQILLAFRKLQYFARRRELSPSYQKKTYLSDALDFLEVDLHSLDDDTDVIREWRDQYVQDLPPPARRPRYSRRAKGRRKKRRRAETSGSTPGREGQSKKKRRLGRRRRGGRSGGKKATPGRGKSRTS